MKIKQFFKEKLLTGEGLLISFIFLFTIINWVLLTCAEKLGPPDVYKLYGVAEKLFSGDFKIGIVPPLFPLIQYPLSKVIGIFTGPMEAFVMAGRIISLLAGLGVLMVTYLLLKRFAGKFAVLGILFLVISPWYLKLLAFPITDMLYLFFVTLAFYSFLPPSPAPGAPGSSKKYRWLWSVMAIFAGVLTRFEGVLLICSAFLNYFRFKKKTVVIALASIPVLAALMFFFFTFADRFFAHFRDIILAQKSYLYIFLHPMDFLNVIYGNVLFFIPFSYPYMVKLILLVVILALFVYGLVGLFKRERRLAMALLAYELIFLIAKGYVDTTRPDIEFRRIFSGLWIFYLICFLGGYFFMMKMKEHGTWRQGIIGMGVVLALVLAISQPLVQPLMILVALPLFSVLVLVLKDRGTSKALLIPAIIIFCVFTAQIFFSSYVKSRDYVVSMAPKAPYAAAQWFNFARIKPGATILSYTDNLMMGFYVDRERLKRMNIKWETFTIPLYITKETRAHYIRAFFKEIRERKVDYIICDNYVVQKPEFRDLNQAKRLLFEERENTDLFRVRKYLLYKGENVGYVFKPVDNDKANH